MRTAIEKNISAKKSLSVVLLCYNDAATIGDCIAQAFEFLSPFTSELEIIVVEDGSKDASREVLEGLMVEDSRLHVIMHDRNQGYGRSLGEGIRAAHNQYVLCVDGDNQFDFTDAGCLLELADGRYDIVSGCRQPRADPWYRCMLGWVYNQVVRAVFWLPVKDVDCGFKLLDRRSAEYLFPLRSNVAVWVEAMVKAKRYNYRFANILVHHRPRQSGRSTVFNWSGVTRLALEVISLGIRTADSEVAPMNDARRRIERPE